MTTWTRVRQMVRDGRELQVGVIGAGYVARGLVHLLDRLDGFRPAAVINRTVERGVAAYHRSGHARSDIEVARDGKELRAALSARRPVVVSSADLAIEVDELDVLVEATGSLDHAAQVMLAALRAGRSVVSINAEVDVAIGWLLHATAAANGGVYSICDGDQPGVLMRALDRVEHMGLETIAAVNCKRHLDVHQSRLDSAPYAARDETSIAVTVAAGDGTKMNIEQAVVANLTGLVPTTRGMHGVTTTLEHALDDLRALLASTDREGVVEYTLGGDFGAGVCVVGRAPDPEAVATALRFFKLGDGPEYLFFSPYTLVHFEMPRSIAEIAFDRSPLWSPSAAPVADVVAVAKRDLAAGDRLEGIGGDECYGQIDTIDRAGEFLPIVLADHARMVRPVQRDDPIPFESVDLDLDAPIVALRGLQESLLAAGSQR